MKLIRLNEDDQKKRTLNLRRNGFVAAPEKNFSDDGNYFRGYYYDPDKTGDKRFETSKLVSDGEAYIQVRYYDDITGKTMYFDDLNGVDYNYAIDHIKDLTDQIDEYKAKIDRGETAPKDFTEDELNQIKAKALQLHELSGDSYTECLSKVLKKLDIDEYSLRKEVRDQLYSDVERSIRNARQDNPVIVKAIANRYLKDVIKKLNQEGKYDSRGRWQSAPNYSLEKAMDYADKSIYISKYDLEKGDKELQALVDAGAKVGEFYRLSDLTDATQEKIKNWVKNKIETLYDFE